jgi:hypothetical protein
MLKKPNAMMANDTKIKITFTHAASTATARNLVTGPARNKGKTIPSGV